MTDDFHQPNYKRIAHKKGAAGVWKSVRGTEFSPAGRETVETFEFDWRKPTMTPSFIDNDVLEARGSRSTFTGENRPCRRIK